jgi:hypothetical protein
MTRKEVNHMATVEKKQTTRKAAPKKAEAKETTTTEVVVPKGSMRPEALATELGVSGKNLRAWLRRNHARPAEAKNTAWIIPAEIVKEAREAFKKQEAK